MNQGAEAVAGRVLEATLSLAGERYRAGRLTDAEALFRRALEMSPTNADACNMLGVVLAERANPLQALKYMDRAIQLAPERSAFHTNRGEILRRWGLVDEGLQSCRRAAELAPDSAEARNNLGLALLGVGRVDEAVPHFRAAILANGAMAQAHFNLGRALRALGQLPAAREAQAAALRVDPKFAEAWYELACVQERTDDLEGSLASCRQALACKPAFPEAWVQIGDACTGLADDDRALDAYRRALEINPDYAVARYQLSLCLLGRGAFDEGWKQYESRQDPTIPGAVTAPLLPMPMWQGEPISGRRLLVLTEQGYGDHIQFCRLVPHLASHGIEVWMGSSPELAPLMLRLPGVSRVFTQVEEAWTCGCDYWTFVGSLPMRFGVKAEAVPAQVPYLGTDADKLARWRERFAAVGSPCKVGLVWAGRPTHGNDWRRSIALDALAPLAEVEGVTFVSLQKGQRSADAAQAPASMDLLRVGDELADFGDTAAVLSAVDLLISVDSSPVHLAGALGRPVWTLLPFQPDWRWRLDEEVSRWYPTMRLFRQQRRGEWGDVVGRVADALRGFVRSRG
jgi:tetratricopeptide (TPR) repeat protein